MTIVQIGATVTACPAVTASAWGALEYTDLKPVLSRIARVLAYVNVPGRPS